MGTNAEVNPFAMLLSEADFSAEEGVSKELVEEVLLFTLRHETPNKNNALLYLGGVVVPDETTNAKISEELLAHALFERLMLQDTLSCTLINERGGNLGAARETKSMPYLFRAFIACNRAKSTYNHQECDKLMQLILTNTTTCLSQPELFYNQEFHMQWLELFEVSDEHEIHAFLVQSCKRLFIGEDRLEALGMLKAIFYPVLNELQRIISDDNIVTIKDQVFHVIGFFVRDKQLPEFGEMIIDYMTPNPNAKGVDYLYTLLGQLLSISILPRKNIHKYEFFAEINLESQHIDATLWQCLSNHHTKVFKIVKQLLLCGDVARHKTLQWIANCLHANASLGHLWSNISENTHEIASDGFMIGLTAVLLRLCEPLFEPTLKVLLSDPTYSAVTDDQRQAKQVHMLKISEETCLLPAEENTVRSTADKYNFITELFYMTHKAYQLGYHALIERFTRSARELHNMQNTYTEMLQNGPVGSSEIAKAIVGTLKELMQKYLCMRNTLMEPENDTLLVKFFEASSIWLVEIALITPKEYEEAFKKHSSYAPHTKHDIRLPLSVAYLPPYMNCVPEYIVDNVVAYLNFTRHYPSGMFLELYSSSHGAFFRLILLYMGSAELVKNPHLRAKLAEALEVLLPKQISGSSRNAFYSDTFDKHPDRMRIVNSLLNVFVSIEMTGQSVQFEQKFNYRRPMYAIIEYLWEKEEQVQCFRDLAKEAEDNMEAIEPPLFLRFINLLINDAIFLLDDSLSNLEQIRVLQEAQDNGEWENLPQSERHQHASNLHHLGQLTRFDNILGRDTINTIKLLTSENRSIFCHNSMVNRIAAMLNYFLLILVGPQKEKLKVKNKDEFKFDPAHTVREICQIYVNLGDSDNFCLAVSQDGRSYSTELFSYAEHVLIRVGGGQLIGEITDLAAKVTRIERSYKQDQEYLSDTPDEFLDPIMNTLMTDPVILPSSKVTVDRTTIARHLLSDQIDPFNRAPLTMDKVLPNHALKAQIQSWMAEKRAAGISNSDNQLNHAA